MPCNMMDGVNWGEVEAREARKKAEEAVNAANQITDILCRVLRALPPEILTNMDADVRDWFEAHKKHDAAHGRPHETGR